MKNRITNLGKVLSKADQKRIMAGHGTQAQIACRVCNPFVHYDNCDMELACTMQEASVLPRFI